MESTWEYRLVNMPSANGGDDWLELREVYYDGGNPVGHSNPCLGSETGEGVGQVAAWIASGMAKPPLHEKDFPADYDPEAYV